MPELPEVITIRNDLRKEVLGKKITGVEAVGGYKLGGEFKGLVGQTVDEVTNVAKLLLLRLSGGDYLVIHLNISGVLLWNTTDPWVRATLEFEGGGKLHY